MTFSTPIRRSTARQLQAAQFGHPQAGGVQQFEHRPIPQSPRLRAVRRRDPEPLDLLPVEVFRQSGPLLGGRQEFARILPHFALPRQETVIVSERCDVAGDRARRILSPIQGLYVIRELLRSSLLLWHRKFRVKPFQI